MHWWLVVRQLVVAQGARDILNYHRHALQLTMAMKPGSIAFCAIAAVVRSKRPSITSAWSPDLKRRRPRMSANPAKIGLKPFPFPMPRPFLDSPSSKASRNARAWLFKPAYSCDDLRLSSTPRPWSATTNSKWPGIPALKATIPEPGAPECSSILLRSSLIAATICAPSRAGNCAAVVALRAAIRNDIHSSSSPSASEPVR